MSTVGDSQLRSGSRSRGRVREKISDGWVRPRCFCSSGERGWHKSRHRSERDPPGCGLQRQSSTFSRVFPVPQRAARMSRAPASASIGLAHRREVPAASRPHDNPREWPFTIRSAPGRACMAIEGTADTVRQLGSCWTRRPRAPIRNTQGTPEGTARADRPAGCVAAPRASSHLIPTLCSASGRCRGQEGAYMGENSRHDASCEAPGGSARFEASSSRLGRLRRAARQPRGPCSAALVIRARRPL